MRTKAILHPQTAASFLTLAGAFLGLSASLPARAQSADDLRILRERVEQQSQQLDTLEQKLDWIVRKLDGDKAPPPAASTPPSAPAPTGASASAEAAGTASAVPKAELAPGWQKHSIEKGETLTSIAKRYNIAPSEIKKANSIKDERKLQIGQVLNIPKPSEETPAPASPAPNP